MGYERAIAEKVTEQGADYIMPPVTQRKEPG